MISEEITMPSKECVTRNGKLYCYNSETKKIDRYTIESIDLQDCPAGVVEAILDLLAKKAERKEEV